MIAKGVSWTCNCANSTSLLTSWHNSRHETDARQKRHVGRVGADTSEAIGCTASISPRVSALEEIQCTKTLLDGQDSMDTWAADTEAVAPLLAWNGGLL